MNEFHSIDLSTLFNSVPNPVFIKDENLRFIFINRAYERMFNVKIDYVVGKTVLELEYLSNEERLFYQEEDSGLLQGGKMKHHIFNYLYKGKYIHTCLYWSSGFIQKNGTRGVIGVIVDINAQTNMIRSLRKKLSSANFEKKVVAEQSRIDPLTHLHTRGMFDEILQKFAVSADGRNPFACIMLDIDHFKLVNDVFGHAAGDAVLRDVASAISQCARKHDVVCRYGGEEFVVLLPGSGLNSAIRVAERIRRRVADTARTPDGQGVTISAGCSEHAGGEAGTAVVRRADEALYAAKNSGRNRVCS